MNLKAKVERIEARIMENGLQFCSCFTDFVAQMIRGVYDNVPFSSDDSKLPKGFCEKCRKPVNVEFIENFNRQLEMVLPAYADAPVSESAVSINTPAEAARTVRNVDEDEIPSGTLSRSQAAVRLQISLGDVERHIKSGRLILDVSKKFITRQSFDELKVLLIRQRNATDN